MPIIFIVQGLPLKFNAVLGVKRIGLGDMVLVWNARGETVMKALFIINAGAVRAKQNGKAGSNGTWHDIAQMPVDCTLTAWLLDK